MTIELDGFAVPESLIEHVRRFYAEGAPPAPARTAATVLLLRSTMDRTRSLESEPSDPPGGGDGLEVYVIRRLAAMTFGGMYAFPGGGVDPSDSQVHVGWAGPTPEQWGRRLGLPADRAQAVVCAAAREVFEEAGVLLAGPEPDSVVGDVSGDDWEGVRQDLVARRIGFAALLRERRLTLRSDLLLPWSRWVTPEFEPRRFDTYFFLALLPDGQRPRDVSGEADHTMWVRPADALTRVGRGELNMLPPTMVNLAEVAAGGDLAGVLAAVAERDLTRPILPTLDDPTSTTPRFVLDRRPA